MGDLMFIEFEAEGGIATLGRWPLDWLGAPVVGEGRLTSFRWPPVVHVRRVTSCIFAPYEGGGLGCTCYNWSAGLGSMVETGGHLDFAVEGVSESWFA